VAGATREVADRLLALAGRGELVVADGNHRSLAALTSGLERFLAVVTTPDSLAIQPYHRLVTRLPGSFDDLLGQLRDSGAGVSPVADVHTAPLEPGTVLLYAEGRAAAVALPARPRPVSSSDSTTPWSSACCSAGRLAWTLETNGSGTSAATTPLTGWWSRSTVAAPTSRS